MKKFISCFLFLLLLKISYGEWIPEKIFDSYIKVSNSVETPHFTWAKPYGGKKLRILVIGPAWGQRESVELMERFDFDVEVIMTQTKNLLVKDNTYGAPAFWRRDKKIEEIDKKLKEKYDVIIIGAFDWGKLLTKYRYEILKKIYNGTGLVYISPPQNEELNHLFKKGLIKDVSFLIRGIPGEMLTVFKNKQLNSLINAGTFGKGKWVALKYRVGHTNQILTPGIHPYEDDWEYEYYMSFLGRVIFWVSGIEKKVFLTGEKPDEFTSENMPSEITIFFKNFTEAESLDVKISLCRTYNSKFMYLKPVSVKSPSGKIVWFKTTLPVLPEGKYIINLVFSSDGKTYDWSSFPISINSKNSVKSVNLEKVYYKKGEAIKGTVLLKKPLTGYTLTLKFYDNFGRILWEKFFKNGKDTFHFRIIPPVPYKTSIHYIKASLEKQGKEISVLRKEISITGREKPVFPVLFWSEPQTDYISKKIYQFYSKLGLTGRFVRIDFLKVKDFPEFLAKTNLFSVPMFPAYSPGEVEQTKIGPIHKECFHNPAFLQEQEATARRIAEQWEKYDVFYYTDGSDKSMHGNCFCQHTLKEFRRYLKKKYRTIQKLNKIWGTNYNDWEEIIPDTLSKAMKTGNFASWVELTRFMEASYAEYMGTIQNVLKKVNPEAILGPDGFGRLNSVDGADWWKILSEVGQFNLYTYQDPPQLEICRSLAKNFPNVKYRTIYWGSYTQHFPDETFMKSIPWYALLHNYNGLFWWVADGKITYPCAQGTIIAPDMRITYPFYLSYQGILKIREGIFHLINDAKRDNCGIAIHYSKTAIYAAEAHKSTGYYVASCTGFEKLLEDMGYQYDYVASQQIEKGILKNFKVLILPFTLALSEKEAEEVKKFVLNGGILISGVKPALYDYYLRPVKYGSLLYSIIAEPGRPLKAGKGTSLILKSSVINYPGERKTEKGKVLRERIYTFLKNRGVLPVCNIKQFRQKAGLPEIETIKFTIENVPVLSFVNYRNTGINFDVILDKPMYVYELVKHNFYGKKKDIPVSLKNGEAAIYVLLNSRIKGAGLSIPGQARRGKPFVFQAKLNSSEKLPGIFKYSVRDPGGKEILLYGGVIKGEKGEAIGKIPFALNDKPGEWKIEVKELISGITVSKKFLLK